MDSMCNTHWWGTRVYVGNLTELLRMGINIDVDFKEIGFFVEWILMIENVVQGRCMVMNLAVS
jgi:hypothetical protein